MRIIAEHRNLTLGWKVILLLLHLLALILAILLALHLRFPADEIAIHLKKHYGAFFLFAFFCLPAFYVTGLYEIKKNRNIENIILCFLWATAVAVILTIVISYSRLMAPGRIVLFLTAFFTILFGSIFTYFYGKIFLGSTSFFRLAFISEDPLHRELINLVNSNPYSGYAVAQVVKSSELSNLYPENVDGLVLPAGPIQSEAARALRKSHFNGLEICDPLFLYGELTNQIPVDYLTEQWLFSAALACSLFHIHKIKRLQDIVVSLVGLLVFLPFFPFLAIAIKLNSRGPVFYKQERVGRNGKTFFIIKLRTMTNNAEKKNQAVRAEKNDPRVTMVGKILRRLRIDEFPQLFNILRGNMSLVGPRPYEQQELAEELALNIPFYGERLLLQPGLTGWAQIHYPYTASSPEDSKRKLQYDLYYYKNASPWLDMLILLKTFRTVLTASGQ
ncbi:MAG: exopolysaccharide biosynthesis polyprenyl glycosylphosphotransferase [Candidatus Ratteibacteria bacterium]|jgi:exopolysaccharide biosynthesis polyprenyl glycosylphosphotransferase